LLGKVAGKRGAGMRTHEASALLAFADRAVAVRLCLGRRHALDGFLIAGVIPAGAGRPLGKRPARQAKHRGCDGERRDNECGD